MVSAEFKLLKSNQLFGFVLIDAQGTVQDVNSYYCQLLDYSPKELIGKNIAELNIIEKGLNTITRSLRSVENASRIISFKQVTKNGRILNLKTNIINTSQNESLILLIQNSPESDTGHPTLSLDEVEKLRHAVDVSNGGIWEWDSISDTHTWDSRAYTMLGYIPHEFIVDRKNFNNIIHPDDRSFLFNPGTAELLKYSDNRFSIKSRFKCKNGNWKMIISRGKAVEFDSDGNPIRFIGTHIDIDENDLRLLTQQKSERGNFIVNSSWEYWTDLHGNPVYVASSCKEITGYSFNEFIDDPQLHLKILHPEDIPIWELYYKGIRPQNEVETRFRIISKCGETKWVHHICTPITSRNGNCLGFRISNKDISEYQKSNERAKRFIDVIEQYPLPILITSLDERIEFANRKILEAAGFHLNELIGKRTSKILDSEIFNEIRQTITSGKVWEGKFIVNDNSPRTINARLKLSSITDPEGEINSYMVIGEELAQTGRKEDEELINTRIPEYKQTRRHTIFDSELNELKDEFVSQASHEFRTPLASISSSAQMIMRYLQKWDREKLAEHSIRINQSVSNLNELIDEILTISATINRKIKVELEKVNFASWIDQIIQECNPILKPGQTIIQKAMIDTAVLAIDKKLMRRIIINLLNNAIKYSNENSPIIIKSKPRGKQLVMSVTDEGIGIDKEDIPFIFDSFYRSGKVKKTKGTGLGLSIVQKTIEFLNGKITVESELGHGSKFTISVPIG